jgi:hypothetical protein
VDVLVPLGDAGGQVAQGVRADVDATGEEAGVLLRDEAAVVPDDVADRIAHHVATLRAVILRRTSRGRPCRPGFADRSPGCRFAISIASLVRMLP